MTTLDPAPAGAASAHGARAATSRRASLTPIRAQCSARAILCGTPHISRDQEDTVMAQERKGVVTLKGTPLTLVGPEIKPGQRAPDFTAVDTSLQAVRLSDAKGNVPNAGSVPKTKHTRTREQTSPPHSRPRHRCRRLLRREKRQHPKPSDARHTSR